MDKPSAPPAMEAGYRIPETSDPGIDPPPYSNVVGSQSQGNTAIPSALANPPHSVTQPISKQQDSSRYLNLANHMATIEKDKSSPENVYNTSMSVRLLDEPMASEVPPPTPRQNVVFASPSRNWRIGKRYIIIRILLWIFFLITFLTGVGVWHHRRAQVSAEVMRLQEELDKMENDLHTDDWDQVEREINSEIPDSIDGNRYKRSDGDPFKNYKEYDFERLNEATLALVNTLEKSGKLVYEQPRYPGSKNHPLFKRNIHDGTFLNGL